MEEKLTPAQKQYGQQTYIWFTRINALSFGSLADSILILYSIRLGADDLLVAILTSFFYLTLPMMGLGKRFIASNGVSKTFGWCWIGRNISASLMILAPFVQQLGYHDLGLATLAIAVFGFFLFRSMGVIANTPLLGDITNQQDRGNFISRVWINSNLYLFLVIIAIALVLNDNTNIETYQCIIAFGCVAGFISSIFLFKIPESSGVWRSGKRPLKETARFISQDQVARKLFIAWVGTTSLSALVVPFSMLSLKRGYLYSDQGALVFAIIAILGGIFVSYLNRLLLDRVGPRPMLFIYTSGFGLVCLLWVIAPIDFLLFHTVLIFLISGMSGSGCSTSLSHYFLGYIPEEHRVGSSLLINIIAGLSAGLVGSLVGGMFLKTLRHFGLAGLNVYRIYFSVIFLFHFGALISAFRLRPLENRRIKDVLSMLFSIRDWRALYSLQKLSESTKPEKDLKLVGKLSELASDLSEDTLSQYLDSPRFFIQTRAMTALRTINFGQRTAARLIEHVSKGEFTSAYLAAEILGEHHVAEAIPALRQALNSKDVFLKGKSMVALARLNDRDSFARITEIFSSTKNPRLLIHGLHALVILEDANAIPIILNKLTLPSLPEPVSNELLFGLCELFHVGEAFYRLFSIFQDDLDTGFLSLKEFVSKSAKKYIAVGFELNRIVDMISQRAPGIREALAALTMRFPVQLQNHPLAYLQKFLSDPAVSFIPAKLLLSTALILANALDTAQAGK
ncbi:MFS transporter [candidate division KSB1 bacterium]|nr:MFS transporter [candidate division KSB1 bacterium]